ncbi:hypothetical protein SFRURICE_010869, partial [Spodoptera frugiperda]
HRYPSISQTNENNFLFCSQFSDRPSFRVVEPLFRWCVLLWKLYLAAAAYRVKEEAGDPFSMKLLNNNYAVIRPTRFFCRLY